MSRHRWTHGVRSALFLALLLRGLRVGDLGGAFLGHAFVLERLVRLRLLHRRSGLLPLGHDSTSCSTGYPPAGRFIRMRSTARRRAGRGRIRWRRVPDHAASQAWWEEPGRVTDFASVGELLKFLRRRARLTQRGLGRGGGDPASPISPPEPGPPPAGGPPLGAPFGPAR